MYQGTLPPRSNKANWSETIVFTDDAGVQFDLTTATEVTVRLRDPETDCIALEAKLSAGTVTVNGPAGTAAFNFTPDQMSALCPGYYDFGTLVTINGSTEQVHLGTVEVLKGL